MTDTEALVFVVEDDASLRTSLQDLLELAQIERRAIFWPSTVVLRQKPAKNLSVMQTGVHQMVR